MVDIPENVKSFLQSQRVGHLATADARGDPHVVPVCFVLLDSVVYSVIDEKPKTTLRLRRLRNIEVNANVALVVDRYDEDWSQLAWVLLRGSATVVSAGPQQKLALSALRNKYPQYTRMHLDDRPVIRFHIERSTDWGLD